MPLPQRKSPRLSDYDYSLSGTYFVTICTHEKQHYFGKVVDGVMQRSEVGQVAHQRWGMIPEFYPTVSLRDFVIMPNHMHGILFLSESREQSSSLSHIIGGYKSGVSRIVGQALDFTSKLWQSRFHDHIIRNEPDLIQIQDYVQTNPARWETDTFYEA